MTPEEFQFASRSLDDLLRNGPGPVPDNTAAAFAKALEDVPPDPPRDEESVNIPWLPSYLDTVYGKRPIRGPHE
jgi:hypothetical protein